METIIRVGEKNNFNQTNIEYKALEKYKNKGKIFVNSNSFQPIKSDLPSIVTINPYMRFKAITGDLSNVKAVRLKVFNSDKEEYLNEQIKCVDFCVENNLNILLTFMRYRTKKTAEKYTGDYKAQGYEWKGNYFRPTQTIKTDLLNWVKFIAGADSANLVKTCDYKGGGCPECMNCTFLTYGTKTAAIKALNLSISGIKDKNGRQGLCQYKCPDCFAKIVTFGKRPQCDKLITNTKITGANKK